MSTAGDEERDDHSWVSPRQVGTFPGAYGGLLRGTNPQVAIPVAPAAAMVSRMWTDTLGDQIRQLALPQVAIVMAPVAEAVSRMWTDTLGDQFRQLAFPQMATTMAPVAAELNRMRLQQYPDLLRGVHFQVPTTLMPVIEEASRALADSEFTAVESDGGSRMAADDVQADGDFTAALDAFIAVGLAGKDLLANTALPCLLTVRQVRRVWGYKAARQALAVFIAVTVTVFWAAWLVNDAGKAPSEALAIASAPPLATLAVLVTVWGRGNGK